MQLIGMLDSPYVRRAAISMHLLGIPFEHRSLSVFRDFEAFGQINPLVKAPTLVCDDGEQLIESSLIIDYAQSLAAPGRNLMPSEPRARRQALRLIGLALVACEKSVQIVYEHKRPSALHYTPWLERVQAQLQQAYAALEREIAPIETPWLWGGATPSQADISVTVAWGFTQLTLPEQIRATEHPALAAYAARAERLPAFAAYPVG
ncbi:MAG: glutathione S-transferase family protein [Dyella sp.]